MIRLALPTGGAGLRLLCLGAHADDIEIGCGGTVLKLARQGALRSVTWVVLSASGARQAEARTAAAHFLEGVSDRRVHVEDFRDGFFPSLHTALKERIEELKATGEFDLVLTHARHDRHQDHRVLSELTRNTWRDHLVLEYEIVKYDGDLAKPNLYVDLDDEIRHRKVSLLLEHFPSQASRQWFDADTFNGLMRIRGLEVNAPSRYAEAFHAHKLLV